MVSSRPTDPSLNTVYMAIFAMLFCCWPCGLVGLIYGIQASDFVVELDTLKCFKIASRDGSRILEGGLIIMLNHTLFLKE